MSTDQVHEPSLPNVHTLKDDVGGGVSGITFGKAKLTVPESGETPPPIVQNSVSRSGKQLFDVESAFNDGTVQEGTIVTDRRRSKRSFGSLLSSAFNEWWGDTQASVQKKVAELKILNAEEEVVVEDAGKRVSVIQEAARYAEQAPRDDHAAVIEKVRTFSHDAERLQTNPITIKAPGTSVQENPVWKALTKENAAVSQQKAPMPVAPALTLPKSDIPASKLTGALGTYAKSTAALVSKPVSDMHAAATSVPARTIPEVEKREPVQIPKPEGEWNFFKAENSGPIDLRSEVKTVPPPPAVERAPRFVAPPEPKPQPVPPTAERVVPISQTPPRETNPLPTALPRTQPSPPRVTPMVFEPISTTVDAGLRMEHRPIPLDRLDTPTQPKEPFSIPRGLLIATVVIVGGGLGVLAAFMVLNTVGDTPEPAPVAVVIPSFLQTDAQVPVPVTGDRKALLSALDQSARASTVALVQLYPVRNQNTVDTPLTTEAFMTLLSPNAPGAFVRALGPRFMLGSVKTTTPQPYLILQSSNFDVAFSGMLAWEDTLMRDLDPFFGTPLTKGTFRDALTANRSIRILRDEVGNERLVYAFLNTNLIIITTNTEALGALIGSIR